MAFTMSNLPYKVLLIEEDPVVASTIKLWLASTCEVIHVTDETDVREKIQMGYWSLVITDFKHPNLNDLDVTNLVKFSHPLIPVLIVTAHQKVDFIITALQNHADGFLFKPLEKEIFLPLALRLAEQGQIKRSKENKIILAIGAHPDDVEIGCGGSLALHRAKGDAIYILTLSRGSEGGDAEKRKKEAQKAADLQGAQLFLGDLEDTKITDVGVTISLIEKVVQQINPTNIYTHSLHDGHQDHRSVFYASVTACRGAPNLYCYQSPSSSVDFKPNLFVEISDFIDKKLEVITAYKSQHKIRPYLQQDIVRSTARYWGRFSNYGYAEPMEVIKQQYV